MIHDLYIWFKKLAFKFWPIRRVLVESTALTTQLDAITSIGLTEEDIGEPTREEMNRAMWRKYEKERRKHDKWVKAEGAVVAKGPPRPPRGPRVPKPDIKLPEEHGDFLILDHHEGGDVLYEDRELQGEFNFRDTILDQLDRYFLYLARMRKRDPDAYGLYRQVGITLSPYTTTATWLGKEHHDKQYSRFVFSPEEIARWHDELPPYFIETRPSFGCIAYGANPLSELHELESESKPRRKASWIPKFMYYVKYEKPPISWQPISAPGTFYGLTVWWDRPQDRKMNRKLKGAGYPQDYGVWVSADGTRIIPLKERIAGTSSLTRWKSWRLPYEMKEWAKSRGVSATKFLTHLFVEAVKFCEEIDFGMIRVNVHKGDLTAVFQVAPHRLAYFFKDRDVRLNVNGGRARIFHLVAPHQRKDGAYVKMHFRGEKEFEWAGYHVQITVPGRDHAMISQFNYGSLSFEKKERKAMKGTVDGEKIGEVIGKHIKTGQTKGLV